MADDIDKAAKGQVVIGLHGWRGRRAAGVVGADPHELQLGYRAVRHVVGEVLLPDIDAELVGDAQIELRVVLDRVVDQVRERGVRGDRVVVVELASPCQTRRPLCRCRSRSTSGSVVDPVGVRNVLYSMYSP